MIPPCPPPPGNTFRSPSVTPPACYRRQVETTLPLRQPPIAISVRDNLDLNNSDLIACNVISRGKNKQLLQVRRFMMVDRWRLVLMEPSTTNLGWGIVRFLARCGTAMAPPCP